MLNVGDIFIKSPFQLLYKHLKNVIRCTELIGPMLDASLTGDIEEVERLKDKISRKEHRADHIKDEIRAHLPKSIFMPVSREDLLKYLHAQDDIADYCEEAALLISMRPVALPDVLVKELKAYMGSVEKTVIESILIVKKLKMLIKTSFTNSQSNEILEDLEGIAPLEEATEKHKHEFYKTMFSHEKDLDPVSIMMTIKVCDALGYIAKSAENSASVLRLMIAKR